MLDLPTADKKFDLKKAVEEFDGVLPTPCEFKFDLSKLDHVEEPDCPQYTFEYLKKHGMI
jgi:hypothetical protein